MTDHENKKYPLCWPHGKPRTPEHKRKQSSFTGSQDKNQRELMAEIKRLGGRNIILSTNIKLRQDGYPYASQRAPSDIGVAVYFDYRAKPMCFACDKWKLLQDNIKSITKTIAAIRGIERWGSSEMMQQAFTGFEALPPPLPSLKVNVPWWEVLGCGKRATQTEIKKAYLYKRFRAHPDNGGSDEQFIAVTGAYEQAINEVSP